MSGDPDHRFAAVEDAPLRHCVDIYGKSFEKREGVVQAAEDTPFVGEVLGGDLDADHRVLSLEGKDV